MSQTRPASTPLNEPIGGWLKHPDGQLIPIHQNCGIGRAPLNQVVLADEKVSRRHATIHAQGDNEFWLIDLGSRNGTYVNGRRITHPIQLQTGDQIQIGRYQLSFNQNLPAVSPQSGPYENDKTVADIQAFEAWLLVADIKGSTHLSQEVGPDELPVITGTWFSQCQEILMRRGGTIDKYLGDGFLAYWFVAQSPVQQVIEAVNEFQHLQQAHQPEFRFVLHRGPVYMGNMAIMGEARLFGPEINFAFRMERLASSMDSAVLLSKTASSAFPKDLESLGRHRLPGFSSDSEFFRFPKTAS